MNKKRLIKVAPYGLVGHLYLFTKRTKRHEQQGRLDPGRVEHDADPGSHGLGRQVAAELGADRAGVPVRAGHLHQQKLLLELKKGTGSPDGLSYC